MHDFVGGGYHCSEYMNSHAVDYSSGDCFAVAAVSPILHSTTGL